ncbi:MAG: ATP synthase subunit I [Lachnospiraceae bacterium]|nr:ATP synthase subunit I [Lachnospiraceae bacterium]
MSETENLTSHTDPGQAPETGSIPSDASAGKLSPALKKELGHILIYVLIGTVLLILVFFLLNLFIDMQEYARFDYTVILGAVCGGAVAFLNFFLMGLTVQKVASDTNKERAANRMKLSYTYRYLMQIAWIVMAILIPCFNSIAGIIPLLFPTLGIKIAAIIFKKY